jgi:hypothetical protein
LNHYPLDTETSKTRKGFSLIRLPKFSSHERHQV